MPLAGNIVDSKALLETVAASFVAGVGVIVVFSIAIVGAARFADARRDDRPAAAAIGVAIAFLALAGTAAAIVEIVRALATERTDGQIAATLNARWLRSGTGQTFTRQRVRYLRDTYGIASFADRFRRDGWLTTVEAARQLGVHPSTAKRFALEGVLHGVRVNDKGDILIAPLSGPLPAAHPGKRFKDRRQYPKLAPQMRQEVQCEA